MQSRVAIIIAAVIALLLIGGIAFAVFGGKKADDTEDVSQLPVSGVADTTGESSESATKVELAPTSARVIYSVPSGSECYVETYVDGKMTPEMLTGPVERSVEVTGVWVITTYSPETINVTVDGTKVELKIDSHYNDMYAYTVDFPAILQKWNSEHGTNTSSTRTTTSTTGSTTTSTQDSSTVSTQSEETKQTYEESVNYDDSVNLEENQAQDEESVDEEEEEEEEEEPVYTEEYEESEEWDGSYVEEENDEGYNEETA